MAEIVDIRALNARFIDGTVNPPELLESHLQVIKQRNPDLNCFVEINADLARKAADASHRRFRGNSPLSAVDGIPIAIKDNIHVVGFKTRNGTKYTHSFEADAAVITRLRDAGAVIVGKLNMDECALGVTTDNPHNGRTQNPWRRNYVPGGSSGGASRRQIEEDRAREARHRGFLQRHDAGRAGLAVDRRKLAEHAAGTDIDEADLTAGRGITDHPHRAPHDEIDIRRIGVAGDELVP